MCPTLALRIVNLCVSKNYLISQRVGHNTCSTQTSDALQTVAMTCRTTTLKSLKETQHTSHSIARITQLGRGKLHCIKNLAHSVSLGSVIFRCSQEPHQTFIRDTLTITYHTQLFFTPYRSLPFTDHSTRTKPFGI